MKIRRQHPDDLPALAVDEECTSHRGRVAAELPAPIPVGQDHCFGCARQIVLLGEFASEHWLDAKKGKRAVGD